MQEHIFEILRWVNRQNAIGNTLQYTYLTSHSSAIDIQYNCYIGNLHNAAKVPLDVYNVYTVNTQCVTK